MATNQTDKRPVLFARHDSELLQRRAKAQAAMEGLTLEALIVKAVTEYLARVKK